jgi:prepilin-type N-terminal cleavage/methylation domain-containing protein
MMSHKKKSGFTLVEILVVLVVMVILASVTYSYLLGGKNEKGQKTKTPIQAGKSSACLMNLDQVRKGIQVFKTGDTDEKLPTSLDDLKFPNESVTCPDSKQAYQYSADTGEVHCSTPGHEKN